MTKSQVLDQYFITARHQLLELAAFLDRVERAEGAADFRLAALRRALPLLQRARGPRVAKILLALSDPSRKPIARATTQSACGACPPAASRQRRAKA
jgi:hypothetical protein